MNMNPHPAALELRKEQPRSEVAAALGACRGAFLGIGVFTAVSNILMLTGSFFMLEVYDRVLPSRSVPTLIGLATLATLLYVFQGMLDLIRGRVLVRIGKSLDDALSQRIYRAIVRFPLKARGGGDGLQPLRDLDYVRGFLSGGGPGALFDLPWIPLYLSICFLFHVWIGVTALTGAVLLISITAATEMLTRRPMKAAAGHAIARSALAGAARRNAEVIQAMGMTGRMAALWGEANRLYLGAHERASDVGGGLAAVTRILRLTLQSAVLGVGAYLVIEQEATGGVIIASSILTSRALAPVELAIGNWKGFIAARQGWQRLSELLALFPETKEPMDLPSPTVTLAVDTISVAAPSAQKLIIQDVAFSLKSGQALGVIGPNASGKSTLARALVGVWLPARGKIRLDGAALEQWAPEAIGRHIGYLPQNVELFDGTVAENIARFAPDFSADAVVAAAKAACVHELVLNLPEGYETRIGEGGMSLSAGQRQRIALARALYEEPFLVVLDEPNSNLDIEGDEALSRAVLSVRARGGIVIAIAHRPSALAGVDHVLVMSEGRVQAFGPRDEVLSKVLRTQPPLSPTPLKIVGDGHGTQR